MPSRRLVLFVLAGALSSMGASFRTTNFLVDAPTPQLAQQFGQMAEHWRQEKAMDWLGREMPPWPEPCPLHVRVTRGGAGGATQFSFDRGRVLGQNMNIEGSLDRLLVSVLPHEVTHTVFAFYFRTPVPRWADEGGAVLSEDDIERNRHDQLCRDILNTPGRAIPLRTLFELRDYPRDVMALYAQGFSVAQFLVNSSNRPTFLAFVAMGMQRGWDVAAQTYYHYNSVEDLQAAWLTHMHNTRRQQPVQLANNTNPVPGEQGPQVYLYNTVPPAQPLSAQPALIVRGQSPGSEGEGEQTAPPSQFTAAGRPRYLPEPTPAPAPAPGMYVQNPPGTAPHDLWQPAGMQPPRPPSVILGAPQSLSAPPPMSRPAPAPVSPVGYPY